MFLGHLYQRMYLKHSFKTVCKMLLQVNMFCPEQRVSNAVFSRYLHKTVFSDYLFKSEFSVYFLKTVLRNSVFETLSKTMCL